jgi:predicted CopG family antitoxin
MRIHYGFVDIAIKQELRDILRDAKGGKSYSKFLSELLQERQKLSMLSDQEIKMNNHE